MPASGSRRCARHTRRRPRRRSRDDGALDRGAVRDLIQIHLYIEADDPDAADQWISKLFERAEHASRMPMAGRLVREYARSDLREVLVKGYRTIYRVDRRDLVVVTVLEGHRLLPDSLDPDEE